MDQKRWPMREDTSRMEKRSVTANPNPHSAIPSFPRPLGDLRCPRKPNTIPTIVIGTPHFGNTHPQKLITPIASDTIARTGWSPRSCRATGFIFICSGRGNSSFMLPLTGIGSVFTTGLFCSGLKPEWTGRSASMGDPHCAQYFTPSGISELQ